MKNNRTTFFDKLVIFIAIVVAIGLICGGLAGNKDPVKHTFFAFAGLCYPFLLLINVILLVWWLLRRKWIFVLITVLIIGFGWRTLIATFGLFGTQGNDEKADPKLIRVMTYNVHNFKPYGEVISVEVKDKMFNIIKGQHPDIVCFQEFFTKFKGPYDTIDSLKKILKTPYYYFMPTSKSETEALGLAIFSKYPIESQGSIDFPNSEGNASLFIDIKLNNQQIRIYNIHLQSISFDTEDYVYLDKVKEMDPTVNSTKRIVKMLNSAFKKRSVQVELMKAHMRNCKTPYIISGDFNDTPASYAATRMTDSLNNAFIKKGQGLGRTYNGKFPNFQIDYIASTKDLEIMNYRIIEAKLSDHFPVRSDLRLKSNP